MYRFSLLLGAGVLFVALPAAAQVQSEPLELTQTLTVDAEYAEPVGPTLLGTDDDSLLDSAGLEAEPTYVTGSRLPRPEGESVAPILVIYGEDLELSGRLGW